MSRKQAQSPPKAPEPAKKAEQPKKVVAQAPAVAKGAFDPKAFTKGGAT